MGFIAIYITLFADKNNRRTVVKLKEKISWLMGRLQRQLFPFLEEYCVFRLTEQEKHLVKILGLVKVESHTAFQQILILPKKCGHRVKPLL